MENFVKRYAKLKQHKTSIKKLYNSLYYKLLPPSLQSALISCRRGLLYASKKTSLFNSFSKQLLENEFDRNIAEDHIKDRLESILNIANQNTKYYQNTFDIHDPTLSLSDKLAKFKIIDKDEILKYPNDFINQKKLFLGHAGSTSGTTGSPRKIYQSYISKLWEFAFIERQMRWAGCTPQMRKVWIRADRISDPGKMNLPIWRKSYFDNTLLLSSYHLNQSNIWRYIFMINEFQPEVIQAYPSSILTITHYMKMHNLSFKNKLKAIITSSENLENQDKIFLEDFFQCRIFDWYGQYEKVAAIGTCEWGTKHLLTDYSDVLLQAKDQNKFKVIGTNVYNDPFPLIKFDTDDCIRTSNLPCQCGRHFPRVTEILGRGLDYIVGLSGARIYILCQVTLGVDGLIASQFVQKKREAVEVHVVTHRKLFDRLGKNKLIRNCKSIFGDDMKIVLRYVDKISRSHAGKQRIAISLCD